MFSGAPPASSETAEGLVATQNRRPNILDLARSGPGRLFALVIDGQLVPVGQEHLLEPFGELVVAIDALAQTATDQTVSGDERTCLEQTYRVLARFFKALLPSASAEAIDGLAYSVSLLLVGEAIEAAGMVETTGRDGPEQCEGKSASKSARYPR